MADATSDGGHTFQEQRIHNANWTSPNMQEGDEASRKETRSSQDAIVISADLLDWLAQNIKI